MTTFTIALSDGRTAEVQADEPTTRADGSLWLLKAVAKPPAAMAPVAIFARGLWQTCYPQGAAILWLTEPQPAHPEPPQAMPSFA